jgi:predicted membrane protein (TIGR00267 family)
LNHSDEENHSDQSTKESESPDDSLWIRTSRELELTDGLEIARRYLTMNGFDGALTMLGLLIAGLVSMQTIDPRIVVSTTLIAAVASSVAMCVSGFSGAYMAESAERDRELDEMRVSTTSARTVAKYADASKTTILVVAAVDGLSPLIVSLLIMFPLFLVPVGLLGHSAAFAIAILICLALLFLLGVFLGHVSRSSIWKGGVMTLFAGLATALLILLVSMFTGIGFY